MEKALASLTSRPRFGPAPASVLVALLLLLLPAAAAARGRISLSLPSAATTGARVPVSGTLAGRARRRHVVLQALAARRWRVLAAARVSHRRFRMVFTAPAQAGVLIVRAVVYRGSRRVLVSRPRRLRILAAPAAVAPIGRVAGWGNNSHYQLGGGFKSDFIPAPVWVPGLSGVTGVAATYFSSYALQGDGIVQAWGGDYFAELGNGFTTQLSDPNPTPVTGLTGVSEVAAGGAHAIALLSNGSVATWGGNRWGQLGNGTSGEGRLSVNGLLPVIVPGLGGVVAVAAGGADDAALLANGTVLAWGENKNGQLGDGTKTEKDVPTPVRGLSGVKAIAMGGVPSDTGHLLALLDNGTVMAVGDNHLGQLGDGSTATSSTSPVAVKGLSGVQAISASGTHSMALLANGSVMAWGSDKDGQLGIAAAPEACGINAVACSRAPVPVRLGGVSAISAGLDYSLALSGGRVFAWGANEFGQLGDGGASNSSMPAPVSGIGNVAAISAGEYHSLALVRETGLPAILEVSSGAGSLTLSWRAAESGEAWTLAWREAAYPYLKWGTRVHPPPPARSYTITGLAAKPYEVYVSNKSFGIKIVVGTPLP